MRISPLGSETFTLLDSGSAHPQSARTHSDVIAAAILAAPAARVPAVDVPIGHVCLRDVQRELPQVQVVETAVSLPSSVSSLPSVPLRLCCVWFGRGGVFTRLTDASADSSITARLLSLATTSRIFTDVLPSTCPMTRRGGQRPVPTWKCPWGLGLARWAVEEESGFEGVAQSHSAGNVCISHVHKLLAGFIQAWTKQKSSCIQNILLRM